MNQLEQICSAMYCLESNIRTCHQDDWEDFEASGSLLLHCTITWPSCYGCSMWSWYWSLCGSWCWWSCWSWSWWVWGSWSAPLHCLLRPEEALDGSMDPGPPYGPGAPPCDPHMDPSLLDLRSYHGQGPAMSGHGMGPPEPPMGPLDLGPGPPDHQAQHGSPKYICL